MVPDGAVPPVTHPMVASAGPAFAVDEGVSSTFHCREGARTRPVRNQPIVTNDSLTGAPRPTTDETATSKVRWRLTPRTMVVSEGGTGEGSRQGLGRHRWGQWDGP